MEHTKEPWIVREVDGLVAIAHSGGFVLEADDDRQNVLDARRIVACVNACVGLPTELLEMPSYSIKSELDILDGLVEPRLKLVSQRDKMLSALRDIIVISTSRYAVDKAIEAVSMVENG